MRVHGIGIDVVDVSRIAESIERRGEPFLARVFTDAERSYCDSQRRPAMHYAARFAAKEAVAKAFGTGFGGRAGLTELEVMREAGGRPVMRLSGEAKAFAEAAGITEVQISMSHTEQCAVANAIALCSQAV